MKFLIVFSLIIGLVVGQRGAGNYMGQQITSFWGAPAGAAISLAGRDYALNHPPQPKPVIVWSGCAQGNCDSKKVAYVTEPVVTGTGCRYGVCESKFYN